MATQIPISMVDYVDASDGRLLKKLPMVGHPQVWNCGKLIAWIDPEKVEDAHEPKP